MTKLRRARRSRTRSTTRAKKAWSSRPIEAYCLRSQRTSLISVVDSDNADDDVTLLQCSQQSTEPTSSSIGSLSSSSSSSRPTQRMTAAMRKKRDRLAAAVAAAHVVARRTSKPQRIDHFLLRSSSLPITLNDNDDDNDADADDVSDDDRLPLPLMYPRSAWSPCFTQRSSSSTPVVRLALSDIANVIAVSPQASRKERERTI